MIHSVRDNSTDYSSISNQNLSKELKACGHFDFGVLIIKRAASTAKAAFINLAILQILFVVYVAGGENLPCCHSL